MAHINMKIKELIYIVKENMEENDKIKDITVLQDNKIQLIVRISPLLPDMNVLLAFHKFERGLLYLNVITKGPIKLILGLLNEISLDEDKDKIRIIGQDVVVDVNKMMFNEVKGMKIKDVNIKGDDIFINVVVRPL